MLMLGGAIAGFVVVMSAVGAAFAWVCRAQAEMRMWQAKYKEIVQRQSHSAWQGNRNMVMY
jgi:hypothetical protein